MLSIKYKPSEIREIKKTVRELFVTNSFRGTGKTTYLIKTLQEYYKNTGKKGILVVTNRKVADYFSRKYQDVSFEVVGNLEHSLKGKEETLILFDNVVIDKILLDCSYLINYINDNGINYEKNSV